MMCNDTLNYKGLVTNKTVARYTNYFKGQFNVMAVFPNHKQKVAFFQYTRKKSSVTKADYC